MLENYAIEAGVPNPLGATFDGNGVNFAVFSRHASQVTLCLFNEGGQETHLIAMPERDGHVWHGYIPGMGPGQQYGFRVHGPFAPEEGHRFNPYKLLIDPYAKRLTGQPIWNDALYGYVHGEDDLSFDTRDSAPYMPRSIVTDPSFSWGADAAPRVPMDETVFYEAHVKGLTATHPGVEAPGTYQGMASPAILDHLVKLGVTTVELLPTQAFVDDRFLVERGLRNYWGYMTYGFFAPEPRYMSNGSIAEFQQMVARYHSAGIEVILDVVYNHTAEGSELGPTLAFRGLDNASYYRLAEDKRYYINDAGCGNSLDFDNPFTLRMVMDSLRYWVEVMHVDGFRFDLCSSLGRTDGVFNRDGPFFRAIRQDPVLNRVKLIAEPWDLGPDGYQLGAYQAPFGEWNDKFRDDTRRFWRGDAGMVAAMAGRLSGSAPQFDHDGRAATASVNFITAHDGFTLRDLVSYREKHNEANGEDNRDGHSGNHSDNFGVEGDTHDPDILAARRRRRRNLITTLMLSQGTPLLLAGDEIGNSQGGNNNTYCQDSEIGWVHWADRDDKFLAFCQKAIAFRKAHPVLRQRRFLHSKPRYIDGASDLFWRRTNGAPMRQSDWDNPDNKIIVAEMRMASGTPAYIPREAALLVVLNVGDATEITPPPHAHAHWVRLFDTAQPDPMVADGATNASTPIDANCVVVFELQPDPEGQDHAP
ncbi:glycogen debranching protein GlgX [Rhodobacteraceae bacterium N5(2021)]|uniref:Glycogen debranching protein GlgX n=1 Tax=Gymnodinialimonas phycosphaerae TaxID=2841589 RepID=A0A975YHP4_9RHOB|nr:glycogen debranching protein GlgX [Gymnodinialimonas phycosphaerae]MBY4892912.1 glycogen debranching protein GlgX [Gymnodinialimonas phycosphaerae]